MTATHPVTYNAQQQITAGKEARARLLSKCTDEHAALAEGFKSITQGWAVRRYDQCLELDRMVSEMGRVEFRLVLKTGRISIWRKR